MSEYRLGDSSGVWCLRHGWQAHHCIAITGVDSYDELGDEGCELASYDLTLRELRPVGDRAA